MTWDKQEREAVFPASAGMNREAAMTNHIYARIPRIRGDEPDEGLYQTPVFDVFPASAGMNRPAARYHPAIRRIPRIRGDEPPKALPA